MLRKLKIILFSEKLESGFVVSVEENVCLTEGGHEGEDCLVCLVRGRERKGEEGSGRKERGRIESKYRVWVRESASTCWIIPKEFRSSASTM